MLRNSSIALFGACALSLAACGGGSSGGGGDDSGMPPVSGGGATAPASFSTPDDGIQQAVGFFFVGDGAFDMAPGDDMAKTVTTQDCGAGGTISFDDETGRTVFDNCRESGNGFSSRIDGVLVDACTAGGAASESPDNCGGANGGTTDETVTFGESGVPLVSETSGNNFESSFSGLGMVRLRATDTTTTTDADFEFSLGFGDDSDVALVADGLSVFEDVSSGNLQMSIDGGFGIDAAGQSGCGLGFATYETVSPITFDQNDEPFAGELNLTSESGDSANLVFNNDGSITVTVNGAMQTYQPDDYLALCGGQG